MFVLKFSQLQQCQNFTYTGKKCKAELSVFFHSMQLITSFSQPYSQRQNTCIQRFIFHLFTSHAHELCTVASKKIKIKSLRQAHTKYKGFRTVMHEYDSDAMICKQVLCILMKKFQQSEFWIYFMQNKNEAMHVISLGKYCIFRTSNFREDIL